MRLYSPYWMGTVLTSMRKLLMNRRTIINTIATLPSHYYYDETHYKRELEAFWYRHWICVGRHDDITAIGDYRVVEVGDQSVIVTRDNSGASRLGIVRGRARTL